MIDFGSRLDASGRMAMATKRFVGQNNTPQSLPVSVVSAGGCAETRQRLLSPGRSMLRWPIRHHHTSTIGFGVAGATIARANAIVRAQMPSIFSADLIFFGIISPRPFNSAWTLDAIHLSTLCPP